MKPNHSSINLLDLATKVGIDRRPVSMMDIAIKVGFDKRPISMVELAEAVDRYLKHQSGTH